VGVINLLQDVYRSSFQDKSKVHLLHLISWPTPTEKDLAHLASTIYSLKVSHIHSIGCGTGLLEWLLAKALLQYYLTSDDDMCTSKIEITGIEEDFKWWTSSYAPPTFIPLQFLGKDFAAENPFGDFDDLAMFIYSNSISRFKHYVGAFQGAYVLIIGPLASCPGDCDRNLQEHHENYKTEDLPDNFRLPKNDWKLIVLQKFGLVKTDHFAIYKRIEKNFEPPPRKSR